MIRKVERNFRVVVIPEEPYLSLANVTNESKIADIWFRASKSLMKNIERHIDFANCYVDHDFLTECSFCNSDPEPDSNGQPNCCNKAIDEWEATNKEAT